MMRLYMFHDEVGMAIIAARNPTQARQVATWEWGDADLVHLGDAHTEDQPQPELIAEAITDPKADKRWRGKTLLTRMWEELDETYDAIIKQQKKKKANPAKTLSLQNYARGLAFCIAQVQYPYLPDMDAVREKAEERWEERNG